MRFALLAVFAFAVSTLAAPPSEVDAAAAAADSKAIAVKERAASLDAPVLDELIEASEVEKRTANLSPMNNVKKGLLPRDCTAGCKCAKGLKPGLYCGYCTSPHNAVISCTAANEGDCFDKVYQCNSSGGCCVYGYRKSCAQRKGPCNGED
ncbi:uncharacterized protein PV09_06711 [Verruconis gallopava]|uniref:Uncharacterized protein n=1 Tax=Verruconis gallopava TaxID=253628 RepID=A0A0D1YM14_9PEZI|nr:uncharacterized protein PV09_06711 [Verruconis gallopava]KIW01862.1 hypothetical protein PV09_06711 [Verruconis gallopava]